MLTPQYLIETDHACFVLTLNTDHTALTRLQWIAPTKQNQSHTSSPLIEQCRMEINHYFRNTHHVWTLPVERSGTPFQLRVWNYLQTIACGETQTYGAVAKALKTSPRAIGQACANNPLPLIYPCHRVVAAKHLGGFFHQTKDDFFVPIKEQLLQREARHQQRSSFLIK